MTTLHLRLLVREPLQFMRIQDYAQPQAFLWEHQSLVIIALPIPQQIILPANGLLVMFLLVRILFIGLLLTDVETAPVVTKA